MRNHAETNGKQEVSFIFSNFLCLDLKRALSFGAGVGAEEKETLGSAKDQNGMCQTSASCVLITSCGYFSSMHLHHNILNPISFFLFFQVYTYRIDSLPCSEGFVFAHV